MNELGIQGVRRGKQVRTTRPDGTLDDTPPADFETAYHHQQETSQLVGIQ